MLSHIIKKGYRLKDIVEIRCLFVLNNNGKYNKMRVKLIERTNKMTNYKEPVFGESSFTCPYCNTLSSISYHTLGILKSSIGYIFTNQNDYNIISDISISTCAACGKYHIWLDEKLIIPVISNTPMPNEDMPEGVKDIYMEARDVFPYSAKASMALLRLAIQKLCIELGGDGRNINEDIGKLVQQGLPVRIQQALDSIRVIGNNAVHPGTIDLEDNREMASLLFQFINIIVNDMITQPKSINELYSQLPQGALEAIDRRDGNNK